MKCSWSLTSLIFRPDPLVGWLVVLRIYVALAVIQPYRDLEAGDNQSLKFKWRGGESIPGPLAPQAKSLTTRPPPLLGQIRLGADPGRGKKKSRGVPFFNDLLLQTERLQQQTE